MKYKSEEKNLLTAVVVSKVIRNTRLFESKQNQLTEIPFTLTIIIER